MWRFAYRPVWVEEIVRYLRTITGKLDTIMATQKELDAAVADIDATLDVVAAGAAAQAANTKDLEAEIVKLQEQQDAGHTAIDLTGVLRVKNEAKIIADTFAKLVDPAVENPDPVEFVEPIPVDVPEAAAEPEAVEGTAETVTVTPNTDLLVKFPTTTTDDGTTTL